MSPLVLAWLLSALAFCIAYLGWMFLAIWLEGGVPPSPLGVLRGGLFVLAASLIVQLGYGGLIYVFLTRTGLWSLWTVALAYLAPVLWFSWAASDTTRDITGTIPWLVFALIVAAVSWFFARHTVG